MNQEITPGSVGEAAAADENFRQHVELAASRVVANRQRTMTLTDRDIDEFMALCEEEDGVRPSREVAHEAATRLVLLYRQLVLPTPQERDEHRLAKKPARGIVQNEQVES